MRYIKMSKSPELIIDGKSSRENVDNTKERVKDQVGKELEQITNNIWKNFYEIKENWDVEYNLDLVKKYLDSIKDKEYFELKSQNTSAWIMSVQIALSSTGYDVGKIDWILRNKWAVSSNTVEAIVRFQKDNWLRPDWQPGSKTIKKLLEKLWNTQGWNEEKKDQIVNEEEKPEDKNNVEVKENITKAEFDLLCLRASLSDEEMRKVVTYANENEDSRIALGVYKISQNQLKELWKIKNRISLIRMEKITSAQLEVLSNAEELSLDSLREIRPDQAEAISKWNVKKLEILSLRKNMTNDVINKFAKSETLKELWISYNIMTPEQKKILEDNDISVRTY